ncbi:MAG: hypothetical protein AABY40_03300 [Nanoarchaeota archaeon]
MNLEIITGNLKDAYQRLQPGTMLHVDELMNHMGDLKLRNHWFHTADGEIYFLGDRKAPTLAMTRENDNPFLRNIDDAFMQLTGKGNYRVTTSDFEEALAAPETVVITLAKLRLHGDEKGWRYLEIGTIPTRYNRLNSEERMFAERVYGQGTDFVRNMELLKKADINEARIKVLNPGYVQRHAGAGAIAGASWLNTNFSIMFHTSTPTPMIRESLFLTAFREYDGAAERSKRLNGARDEGSLPMVGK